MRILISAFVLIGLATSVAAQNREESLADIRQQLSVLYVEVQRLNQELNTTGGAATNLAGTSVLDRVVAIEGEVQRLTSKTEELENRINRIVRDGTNRIGDLEFRLVELEGGDLSELGETTTLGGEDLEVITPAVPATPQTGGQMAVGEQGDFDRALAAYDAGDFQAAADQFQIFTETYTAGPLTGDAHYYRGQALTQLGLNTAAARAFLDSFSGSPESARAPDALLELGLSLERIGKGDQACLTLGEVSTRFPSSPASIQAENVRSTLGCL